MHSETTLGKMVTYDKSYESITLYKMQVCLKTWIQR